MVWEQQPNQQNYQNQSTQQPYQGQTSHQNNNGNWGNKQQERPKSYNESLAFIDKKTLELAQTNNIVNALSNSALIKAEEIMSEVKKAGMLTQTMKEGKSYINKIIVKVEPAIKSDTREPMLHQDGSPVYKTTLKLSNNNSSLVLGAKEDISQGTQITYLGAFAHNGTQSRYYKQEEISNSPVNDNIKAIASLVQDKFITPLTRQQTYSSPSVQQNNIHNTQQNYQGQKIENAQQNYQRQNVQQNNNGGWGNRQQNSVPTPQGQNITVQQNKVSASAINSVPKTNYNSNNGRWNNRQQEQSRSNGTVLNNNTSTSKRPYSESLAFIEKNTAELGNSNNTVLALSKSALTKANEIMYEIKKAGLLTQTTKDGKSYTNKMIIKVEPAIKSDTREPMLHQDGSPVYKTTLKLTNNNSALILNAKEDISQGTQIAYVGAFAQSGSQNRYYKQEEIGNSPVNDNIKAIVSLVQDKFITPLTRQQTYSSPSVQQNNSYATQQYQTAEKSLDQYCKMMNSYFTVHSEAVVNKKNELVNDAYAKLVNDKNGNEKLYILNHSDTIIIEMGKTDTDKKYVKAIDWSLTEEGYPRSQNDKSNPATVILDSEIKIHDYVNLTEVKDVIGKYLDIEIHHPHTIEQAVDMSKGNYDWLNHSQKDEGSKTER